MDFKLSAWNGHVTNVLELALTLIQNPNPLGKIDLLDVKYINTILNRWCCPT
jgi:hypothetical protein